ncbi:MAG: SufB/SufD family protein [bacterium]
MSDLNKLARNVQGKKAGIGPDIQINDFNETASELSYKKDLGDIPEKDTKEMRQAGMDLSGKSRSGSFVQIDHSVVHCNVTQPGIEILDINHAEEKYDWLHNYMWNAVTLDKDKYTAQAQLKRNHGYFIRSLPGSKTTFPVQACLYMSQDKLVQSVHNIIIAEEGSELHIITGCASGHGIESGLHIGISEFYIKPGAKITFTMIHNWSEKLAIRPRSGTIVEDDGIFLSNYVCMKPVKTLQMYPTTELRGCNAMARYNSILVSTAGSNIDAGAEVTLKGEKSKAEIISRTISTGGTLTARGRLIGEIASAKGHLECRGLILGKEGSIRAIPELEGNVNGVDLSHEAAVGKIAQEEIEYLMARGLNEDEATSVIVRGFLNVDIVGLPPALKNELDKAIQASEEDLF